MSGTYYTQEEAESILTRAAGRKADQTVSWEHLTAMADELGIPVEAVKAAAEEVFAEREDAALRTAFIQERHATFWPHLIPYITVSLFLIVLNILTRSGVWAIYPILGWGIGIVSHGFAVLPTKGPAFENEFAAWKQRKSKKSQRKSRRSTQKADTPVVSETTSVTAESVPVPVVATVNLPKDQQNMLQTNGRR